MLVMFYRHDHKYNKVLLAKKREKKLAAIQAEKNA